MDFTPSTRSSFTMHRAWAIAAVAMLHVGLCGLLLQMEGAMGPEPELPPLKVRILAPPPPVQVPVPAIEVRIRPPSTSVPLPAIVVAEPAAPIAPVAVAAVRLPTSPVASTHPGTVTAGLIGDAGTAGMVRAR